RARDRPAARGGARDLRAPRRRGLQAPGDRARAARDHRHHQGPAPPRARHAAPPPQGVTVNDLLHPAPERLSEYLDGELGDRERAQVATHLEGCGECAGALDQLRAVKVRAASLPARGPETDLWPALEGRLEPRAPT